MLKAILDAIKNGTIKAGTVLLVERLDRLTREGFTIGTHLMMEILRAGIDVHSTATGRVFTRPKDSTAEFMLAMEIGIEFFHAALDNEKRSERVGAAWGTKKSNALSGKAITNMCPFWLKAELGRPIAVIPERVAVVQKIFTLAENGCGSRRIINQLVAEGYAPFTRINDGRRGKIWTLPYVQRLLKSRSVLGEAQFYKKIDGKRSKVGEIIPYYFPSIISQAQFDTVQNQIASKNRVPAEKLNRFGGGNRGGGRYGTEVHNLFAGIAYNAASGLAMVYNAKSKKSPANLVSVWRQGVPQNRINYSRFETAFLGFLSDLDWKSVAGQSESAELKVAQAELETVLSELNRSSQNIAKLQGLVNEGVFSKSLFESLDNENARMVEYQTRKEILIAEVASARSKAQALYSPEDLVNAIRSGNPELRLKLKAEIAKRILRIEINWNKDGTIFCRIIFVNGASLDKGILFQDGDAVLCQ